MARQMRIALDLALISLKYVRGPVANMWCTAKNAISGTVAKPIVDNRLVDKLEDGMTRTADFVETKITTLRDRQLEGEKQYLEKELEKVKTVCKVVRPTAYQIWQYAKVEMAPPMTQSFFQGPGGKAIENFGASIADTTMGMLQQTIKAIDLAAAKRKQALEAALKAKQEQAAAAAKKAAEEKAKVIAAQKAKQAEAEKAKAAAEKAKTKKAEPKKEEPKKAAEAKPEAKPAAKPAVKPEAKSAAKPVAKKTEEKKPEPKKPDPPKKK